MSKNFFTFSIVVFIIFIILIFTSSLKLRQNNDNDYNNNETFESASLSLVYNDSYKGKVRMMNDMKMGECGKEIDGKNEEFAVLSKEWFTGEPFEPMCSNTCINIKSSETVNRIPVRDKCDDCTREDVLVSEIVMKKFTFENNPVLENVEWTFTWCYLLN